MWKEPTGLTVQHPASASPDVVQLSDREADITKLTAQQPPFDFGSFLSAASEPRKEI